MLEPSFERFEPVEHEVEHVQRIGELGTQVVAGLLQVDAHVLGARLVLAPVLLQRQRVITVLVVPLVLRVVVRTRRHAVLVVESAHRHPEEPAPEHPRRAGGRAGGLRLAVLDRSLAAAAIAKRVARNPDLAAIAPEAVEMHRHVAGARIEPTGQHIAPGVTAVAVLEGSARSARHRGRHAVVDHVDHAADGTAAVEQRGRPAQHLDAIGQHGLGGIGVIGAGIGGIAHGHAVLQHQHARCALAADHGLPHPRTEGGERHTGLLLQRLAEGGRDAPAQFVAGNQAGRVHGLGLALVHRRRDDDLLEARIGGVGGDGAREQGSGAEARRVGTQFLHDDYSIEQTGCGPSQDGPCSRGTAAPRRFQATELAGGPRMETCRAGARAAGATACAAIGTRWNGMTGTTTRLAGALAAPPAAHREQSVWAVPASGRWT